MFGAGFARREGLSQHGAAHRLHDQAVPGVYRQVIHHRRGDIEADLVGQGRHAVGADGDKLRPARLLDEATNPLPDHRAGTVGRGPLDHAGNVLAGSPSRRAGARAGPAPRDSPTRPRPGSGPRRRWEGRVDLRQGHNVRARSVQ